MAGWMEWVMRGNFTHVAAFSQIGNFVQVIDPVASRVEVQLRVHPLGCHLPISADIIALDFVLHGATVVKISYDVDETLTSHNITNFFPGCVTICKGLLGVAEWVFTPWQFYQWLLESGGELLDKVKQHQILESLGASHLSDYEIENIFELLKRSPTMAKKDNAAKQQEQRLKDQEQQSSNEAARLRAENRRKSDAVQRGLMGRTSLISTSELGVNQKLG